jgi:cytochrome c nitrite reductase small subunit
MKRTTIAGRGTLGIALGVGAFTFIYAKGGSYMTNDPKACVNCHIMQEQYDGWIKSSHRSVATCNDCHAPADFIGKYSTKAQNGFWHSAFVLLHDGQLP